MFRLNKPRINVLVMLMLAGLLLAGLALTAGGPVLARPAVAAKTSSLAYHDQWRELWEDHITWTRIVIMAILDELPGTDAYVGRLLQNPADMEAALAPYYGDDAAALADLITDHLAIAAEMLIAARQGDTAAFEDARVRWYENAEQNAVQMNQMNPRFWPLEETHHMWVEHLDATLAEAVANLTGDFAGEVAAYDLIHQMALEMADFMSNGVIQQFPNRFNGGVPR
jgi:hypothetical protein